ncbi:unnamed protein product [Diabrotica balteata]|uniref:Uncharacterized protein n=1 Tax=Diabrotica balteata TaxID=107213 RepID=A0A9N9TAA7_DIABA|nr:unnamed protein product [Diabrotica balteata]
MIDSKKDMRTYLKYELAPFSLSLFTENGLRKNVKSQLYELFESTNGPTHSDGIVRVVDAGFLLQIVIWQKNETVEEIMNVYLRYVEKHYTAGSHFVFDGYPEIEKSVTVTPTPASHLTKKGERCRRKSSDNILKFHYQNHAKIPFLQEKFLSNEKNKDKIIKMLMEILQSQGFFCKQAEEDANADIMSLLWDNTYHAVKSTKTIQRCYQRLIIKSCEEPQNITPTNCNVLLKPICTQNQDEEVTDIIFNQTVQVNEKVISWLRNNEIFKNRNTQNLTELTNIDIENIPIVIVANNKRSDEYVQSDVLIQQDNSVLKTQKIAELCTSLESRNVVETSVSNSKNQSRAI